MKEGIDISYHNGNVNLKKARDEGKIEFVMIRAGYGKNNIDQKFDVNAQQAVNLGIPAGIYWFSYASTVEEARKEGEYAVNAASKYWSKTYICFDLEYDTVSRAAKKGVTIGKTTATKMAVAFLNEVASAGYIPVLYTNKDYKTRMFDISAIQGQVPMLKIWYARYTGKVTKEELVGVWAWQYFSAGVVPGLAGKVDVNHIYDDVTIEVNQPKEEEKPKVNNFIASFQEAIVADKLGTVAITGIDDEKTQEIRKGIVLKCVKVKITSSTSKYRVDVKLCDKYLNVVVWVQKRLMEHGLYSGKIDGLYGHHSRNACLEFQKKYKLTPDGVVGYNTLTMLLWN